MPNAVVLSHAEVAEELGHIGGWLERHGYSVSRVHRESPIDELRGDLLIALGSPDSVATGYAKEPAAAEIELVSRWVGQGRPYVGVCFGAQVLACALGGSVRRMPSTFRSYVGFEIADGAPLELEGRWSVWHEDAISAPVSSEVLARLPHADAVFRQGRAWGLQPHIEFDSGIVHRLVDKMSVKPGDWECLYEDLRVDDEGHAHRVSALLDVISADF